MDTTSTILFYLLLLLALVLIGFSTRERGTQKRQNPAGNASRPSVRRRNAAPTPTSAPENSQPSEESARTTESRVESRALFATRGARRVG